MCAKVLYDRFLIILASLRNKRLYLRAVKYDYANILDSSDISVFVADGE